MHFAQSVYRSKCGIPVCIDLFTELVILFAGSRSGDTVTQPVVFVHRCIHVCRQVVVVIGRNRHIQSFGEKILLAIFYRRNDGIAMTMFLAEYDFLVHSILYFFVEMRVGHIKHQPVGPAFPGNSDFSDDRFVVECIIESFYTLYIIFIADRRIVFVVELFHPVVDIVIIVRVILIRIDFVCQSVSETLPEVYIRFMRVERAVRV